MAPLPRSLASRRIRGTLLGLGLGGLGCAGPIPGEDPVPVEPSPERLAEPSPPASLATCAATPDAQAVTLDLLELVTRERGVRWFRAFGPAGEGLTWLRADGSLGFVALPRPPEANDSGWSTCAPEPGGNVRCFNGPSARANGTWRPLWSTRVTLGEVPEVGPLETWTDPPRDSLMTAASDGSRAMLVFDDLRWPEPEYARSWGDDPVYRAARAELWDITAGRALAVEPALLEGWVEPMATWCGETRCTLVARHQQGLSFGADARGETRVVALSTPGSDLQVLAEAIADNGVIQEHAQIVPVDGHHVVVMRTANKLRLVSLDREGRIAGRSSIRIQSGGDYIALDEGLLGFRRDWDRSANDWELLTIAANAKVTERVAVSSSAVGIQAGRVGDGVLVASLTGHVSYDDVGDYAFHTWTFEADQRFVGNAQSTEWATLLGEGTPSVGDGRGGYDVRWLTRPDRAAALLWPTGDAWGETQLIPVRAPCFD